MELSLKFDNKNQGGVPGWSPPYWWGIRLRKKLDIWITLSLLTNQPSVKYQTTVRNNSFPWSSLNSIFLIEIKQNKKVCLDHCVYYFFHVFPPSLKYFRLGGFGIFDIFIIRYFGLVVNLAFQTWNNYCTYIFSKE